MLSLMEASRVLGVPRGVLRACVRGGLLPPAPYPRADLPVMVVAAAAFQFPSSDDSERNVLAVRLARGVLAEPGHHRGTWIVLSGQSAEIADNPDRLIDIASTRTPPLLVVPLWVSEEVV